MIEVLRLTMAWAIVGAASVGFVFCLWQSILATHDCIKEWSDDGGDTADSSTD